MSKLIPKILISAILRTDLAVGYPILKVKVNDSKKEINRNTL